MRNRDLILVSTLMLALVLPATAGAATDRAAAGHEVTEHLRQRLEVAFQTRALHAGEHLLRARELLAEFYVARSYASLWLENGRPGAAARQLLAAIRGARAEGLRPEDYHLHALEKAFVRMQSARADVDARHQVDFELLASDAFLALARDFANGKVKPVEIDAAWFLAPSETDLLPHLDAALADNGTSVQSTLDALLPEDPAYAALREGLAMQRGLRDTGSWTLVEAGPALRPEHHGPRVHALAVRLIELGDLEPDWAGVDHFDGALEAAVNRFQHRHGIQEDGVVGADTLAALNISPQRRVDQIEANMERWRWLPQDLGSEYILVNIASFELTVHTENGEAMRQPVVVGRPYRRTPVFSHRMTYVVLNPSWEMPHRLASLDQLPLIRRDPDYLERMGITVLRGWGAAEEVIDPASVDWATLNPRTFPYRLRQRPGPLNALGEVKFMFPNSHAIYLHDTPHQGIFASADRAVSSGCIRLSDPVALLRWLLAERPDAPQMTPEDIGTMLEEGEETTVLLRQAIPIHLLYWSAWVGADDRLHYTRDIYQRDAPVLEALRASAPATPVHASPTF